MRVIHRNNQTDHCSMPSIHVTTFIAAPIERVFDLSRHIGLHKISQQDNNEEAIDGVTSGLIKQGETVTWKAKHLFKTRFMTVKITDMKSPGSAVAVTGAGRPAGLRERAAGLAWRRAGWW